MWQNKTKINLLTIQFTEIWVYNLENLKNITFKKNYIQSDPLCHFLLTHCKDMIFQTELSTVNYKAYYASNSPSPHFFHWAKWSLHKSVGRMYFDIWAGTTLSSIIDRVQYIFLTFQLLLFAFDSLWKFAFQLPSFIFTHLIELKLRFLN